MRGKEKERGGGGGGEEKGSDSQCSDSWKSIVRELKLVYSTRDTSRCQKPKR